MPTIVKPIGHEDRLSLVDHLDELRTRLVVMVITLVVSFVVCAWQNQALLDFIGKPLATQTEERTLDGKGPLGQIYLSQLGVRNNARNHISQLRTLIADTELSATSKAQLRAQLAQAVKEYRALPDAAPVNKPITIGIGEPFTQTITVAAYFSLLFALPLILFQLYAFLLPAFSPDEKKVALPLMLMVPVLFIAGVGFGYWVVLPAATAFLQNFNADQYNVLVQAKDYYKFAVLTLASIGLVFQLPVALLGVTRTGIISVQQLRAARRYAIVATAVLAMVLPGTDPVSMLFEFAILYFLYEASLVMAFFMDRGKEQRETKASRWSWDDDDEDDDEDDTDEDDDLGPHGGDEDDSHERVPWVFDDDPPPVAGGDDPVLTPPRDEDV